MDFKSFYTRVPKKIGCSNAHENGLKRRKKDLVGSGIRRLLLLKASILFLKSISGKLAKIVKPKIKLIKLCVI